MQPARLSLVLLLAAVASTFAGGSAVVTRTEFRQSMVYPYIFRPVCYLANGGPVEMRFAESDPSCGTRVPPAAPHPTPEPLPPVAIEEPQAAAPATAPEVTVPAPQVASAPEAAPQYPSPAGNAQPIPRSDDPDFTRIPDEVVDYFRNPYNPPPGQTRYEDPIFRPARPEELPKSQAVYTQQ